MLTLNMQGILNNIFYINDTGDLMISMKIVQETIEENAVDRADDITINCIVNSEAHKEFFSGILSNFIAGACIRINFSAEYIAFGETFVDWETNQNLVVMKARLMEVHECFVNETKVYTAGNLPLVKIA